MCEMINLKSVEDAIVNVEGVDVIPDFAVAQLYGVQTKEINQAVKNNPDKFPEGYVLSVSNSDIKSLKSKFLTSNDKESSRGGSRWDVKVFTEKGLYMLATILKGKRAVKTTLVIIETFARLRELGRTVSAISRTQDEAEQKVLIQKGGDMMTDLLGQELTTTESETTLELNFAILKLKHTIKRKGEQGE